MRRVRTLTTGQRVVLIIGLGVLALIVWHWWYLGEVQSTGGWFAYSPNTVQTDTYHVVTSRRPEHLIVPLSLVVAWAALSTWLLGARERPVPD
ncbi:MAG: hypothetical protein ACOYXM_09590 [Actinomycetota bacterium]